MSIEYTLYSILIVLVVIAGLLALHLLNRPKSLPIEVQVPAIDEAVERLKRGVEHYVDVNAVISMVKQLEHHPGALEQLQDYPESVRAAAWLHYINCLGSDLQQAHQHLSDQHRTYPSDSYGYVRAAQGSVDEIRAKLDAAVLASGQDIRPRVV